MGDEREIIKYGKAALADELFAERIYLMASKIGKEPSTKDRFLKMSRMERNHADFWKKFLEKRGIDSSKVKVGSLKTTFYALILKIFGLALTFKFMEAGEVNAVELYSRVMESPELEEDEREFVRGILEEELVHEQELAEEESKFGKFLEHVRDAVLGMNDGLVEILSVTTGLAGAYGSSFHVALGSFVVAIAGALSMGIGAYVAARAQRQVHEGLLGRVSLAARYATHVFKERIQSFMVNKGYSEETSSRVAEESMKNSRLVARVIAEEEYGLREERLEKPAAAGLYTGIAYLLSAFIPVLPYFTGLQIIFAMMLSLILAALALSAIGFIISISAGLSIKKKIMEMILTGLGSAVATFLIGRIFSMTFGITVD